MSLRDMVRLAFQGLWINKLRSGLTVLGLVIGIAAVVTVVSVSQAGQGFLQSQMEKFGPTSFFIAARWDENVQNVEIASLMLDDVAALKENIPELRYVSPFNYARPTVTGPKGRKRAEVYGVNEDYFPLSPNLRLERGRFLTAADIAGKRAVVVISHELAKALFGHTDVVGLPVTLPQRAVTIVGVFAEDKFALEQSSGYKCLMPITFSQFIFDRNYVDQIQASARSIAVLDEAITKSTNLINRRHRAQDLYRANSLQEAMAEVNQATGIVAVILSGVAAISLLVGGIGVMNIMLVSVTERTREIGLRKALGAQRRHILLQFLCEGVVLCLLGGAIGALLGTGSSWALAGIVGIDAPVSGAALGVAFIVSSGVGLFFSLYPANRAARLDPIEALRNE
ncbi:MAG: ABC transporter permease [Heliobacteriaceae bacterium]|nr:ABC transporter permease [Heliobacteriaceae bacterium]